MISDLFSILPFWLLFLLIGVVFIPTATRIFTNFADSGYIFAKILGLVIISYLIWLLGSLHLLPFSTFGSWLIILLVAVGNLVLLLKSPKFFRERIKASGKLIIFEEIFFTLAFFFWAWVRAHEPSIHGLEKFMDFGFINSILRADFFPPKDLWLTPETINYYYFGHLVTAVLTKLSGIPLEVTFNLMMAVLFALTFVSTFSLGLNLFARRVAGAGDPHRAPAALARTSDGGEARQDPPPHSAVICGLLSAFLVTLGGNLHALYAFTRGFEKYWYPDATRFIPYTIHEFPSYSWVVSDLHGHVLDIPFVLLTIGLLLSFLYSHSYKPYAIRHTLLLALILAVMYMTNVWDGIIYLILSSLVLFYLNLRVNPTKSFSGIRNPAEGEARQGRQGLGIRNGNLSFKIFNFKFSFSIIHYSLFIILVIVGFYLFSLPFTLNFKPFVSGLGLVRDRSQLYMLAILWGFFYFFVVSFLIFLWKTNSKQKIRNLAPTDVFILLLIVLSTLLLIFPEIAYVKDIYPLHYRANTMFKLGYQAFIMLSLSSAYIFMWTITAKKNFFVFLFFSFSVLLFIPVAIYPYFAINSYYNRLKNYQGLNGMDWLEKQYPTDYQAILWLQENIEGQPVTLEAVGESYTDYARVSSFTGLPTVVGWPVHEWLWRGTYDEAGRRDAEVRQAYETPDLELTKAFLAKYKVRYVFVGTLERQKYPLADFSKWSSLGRVVFRSGQTTVYQIP